MTYELRLNCGRIALIDEDLSKDLNLWKWGFDGRYVYRREYSNGRCKKIYMHRLIMETPKGFDTDHINGNKLDNRCSNLRLATRSENEANKPKKAGCSSKYKGVCWHKQRGCWKAEIKINGKKKHLGVFLSEEVAAEAYNKAATERFKEFAKLNIT